MVYTSMPSTLRQNPGKSFFGFLTCTLTDRHARYSTSTSIVYDYAVNVHNKSTQVFPVISLAHYDDTYLFFQFSFYNPYLSIQFTGAHI